MQVRSSLGLLMKLRTQSDAAHCDAYPVSESSTAMRMITASVASQLGLVAPPIEAFDMKEPG